MTYTVFGGSPLPHLQSAPWVVKVNASQSSNERFLRLVHLSLPPTTQLAQVLFVHESDRSNATARAASHEASGVGVGWCWLGVGVGIPPEVFNNCILSRRARHALGDLPRSRAQLNGRRLLNCRLPRVSVGGSLCGWWWVVGGSGGVCDGG